MRGLILALVLAAPVWADPVAQGAPNADFAPEWPTQTRAPEQLSGVEMQLDVLAEGLENPWGIAVLPGGGYLVTERPGRLRLLSAQGVSAPILGVPAVDARGQGGLLDVALSEDFAQSRVIYLSYAKPLPDGMTATAVARARLAEDGRALSTVEDIFVQHPPSPTPMHFGARVVPQGDAIFITTGEHSSKRERVLAQDMGTTYGKVVRLKKGAPPEVWTLGHRNMQGAAIHPATGTLWTIEHGPRGGDELNKIVPGLNYGWPVVSYGINYNGSAVGSGKAVNEGFEPPRYYWDPVIAPGGMVFYRGAMFEDWRDDLLIGSLNPGGLVRLRLDGDTVVAEERFWSGEFRLRDVAVDDDGSLLLLDDSAGRVLRAVRR